MSTRERLLKLLSDGAFHSGTALGERLDVSRAAVAKQIQAIRTLGLEVERRRGKGYRLGAAMELLDARAIRRHLRAHGCVPPARLEILPEVDSTNRYLADALREHEASGWVCLAEVQRAGRGRRGRHWIATPYRNLMLSMCWRFAGGPSLISGLSLAVGVALRRSLTDYGIGEISLKWPNDVLWRGRKLAGVLIDVQGESAGPSWAIVGVGINGDLQARDARRIDQAWIDLRGINGAAPARNRLAALLIGRLTETFAAFARDGLAPFRREWEAAHHYQGRRVRLDQGDRWSEVTALGIDELGGLRVRDAAGRERVVYSGEVSLKAVA